MLKNLCAKLQVNWSSSLEDIRPSLPKNRVPGHFSPGGAGWAPLTYIGGVVVAIDRSIDRFAPTRIPLGPQVTGCDRWLNPGSRGSWRSKIWDGKIIDGNFTWILGD